MIDVTVIGFGNVGSTLSLLLLNNPHGMRINVIEPGKSKDGAFLDIQHGMTLYPNKEFYINDFDLYENADFIFYTAGTPNVHGGSRLSTVQANTVITKELFRGRKFNKEPYVIVITNPVDIITYYVQQFSNLPAEKVIGTGTFLDSVRLSWYLSTLSEYHPEDIDATVLGEHGDSQFAAYSMTYIRHSAILEMPEFSKEILDKAAYLTRNAAFQIRETQKGTIYGISKCAEVILNGLLDTRKLRIPLSVKTNTFYNDLLQLKKSIYISVPVEVSANGIAPSPKLHLSYEELKAYRESAKLLESIVHGDT